jgi:hypothetical protein
MGTAALIMAAGAGMQYEAAILQCMGQYGFHLAPASACN